MKLNFTSKYKSIQGQSKLLLGSFNLQADKIISCNCPGHKLKSQTRQNAEEVEEVASDCVECVVRFCQKLFLVFN